MKEYIEELEARMCMLEAVVEDERSRALMLEAIVYDIYNKNKCECRIESMPTGELTNVRW